MLYRIDGEFFSNSFLDRLSDRKKEKIFPSRHKYSDSCIEYYVMIFSLIQA